MNGIEIRPVAPADYDDVIAMLTEIAAMHHRGRPDIFYNSGAKYTRDKLEALVAAENSFVFIADTPQVTCAGYLFCKIRDTEAHGVSRPSRVLWIDDLFVRAEARRGGVASALMAFGRDFAGRKRCDRVELNVWEFNESAIAFYEKNGMTSQRRIMELEV